MCIRQTHQIHGPLPRIFDSAMAKGNLHIQAAAAALNIEPYRLESQKVFVLFLITSENRSHFVPQN